MEYIDKCKHNRVKKNKIQFNKNLRFMLEKNPLHQFLRGVIDPIPLYE